MIIDLIALTKFTLDFDYTLDQATIDLEGANAKLKSPIRVTGKLTKKITGALIEGEIAAIAELECTRCLQIVERELRFSFQSEFVTAENYTAAKEAELQNADLDAAIFAGDKIDVSELVREQILLNLPEQVFCREDCQGLCEKCGANRNLLDCKCIEKETDPRWAALNNLK